MKHLIATAALTLLATTTLNASDMKQIRISTDRTDLVLQVGDNGTAASTRATLVNGC